MKRQNTCSTALMNNLVCTRLAEWKYLSQVLCRVKRGKHQILDIRIPANIRNDQCLQCQSPLFRVTKTSCRLHVE